MNQEQFETLLYEDEGTSLDFKRDQYRFQDEHPEVKSELLKDILAFANAWRRTDAYILIGVEEVKGGRSTVIGVTQHLNDHEIQQFVNSKTQRPIEFSYLSFTYQGQQVGIFHIPVQERPRYLTADYGRLRRNVVYIRRGSATVEADPEEIARMGVALLPTHEQPRLEIQLADPEAHVPRGDTITVEPVLFSVPPEDQIPDYRPATAAFLIGEGTNTNFYRELATSARDFFMVKSVRFALTNVGDATAHDVRLEATIMASDVETYVLDEYGLPKKPIRDTLFSRLAAVPDIPLNCDVTVERVPSGWRVEAEFGKCQPKQSILTRSKLYLGAEADHDILVNVRLFADELSHPIESKLYVRVRVKRQDLPLSRLLQL